MNSAVLHSFAFVKGASFLSAFLFLFFAGSGASIRWRLQNLHLWDDWISTAMCEYFLVILYRFLVASNPASEVVTILGVGFLGSLSTFSTVIMQSAKTIEDKESLVDSIDSRVKYRSWCFICLYWIKVWMTGWQRWMKLLI